MCFRSARTRLEIELAVGPFLAAVRQAAIVTSEESRGIDFTFENGMLLLSGRAAEVGQSRVELPIGLRRPGDFDHAGSALHAGLLESARRGQDDCTLELKDAESAAVCLTDDGYGYVIMPLARDH